MYLLRSFGISSNACERVCIHVYLLVCLMRSCVLETLTIKLVKWSKCVNLRISVSQKLAINNRNLTLLDQQVLLSKFEWILCERTICRHCGLMYVCCLMLQFMSQLGIVFVSLYLTWVIKLFDTYSIIFSRYDEDSKSNKFSVLLNA